MSACSMLTLSKCAKLSPERKHSKLYCGSLPLNNINSIWHRRWVVYFGKFHTACKQSAFAIRLKSRQWIFRTCLLRLGRSKGHLIYHLNIYNKKATSFNWRGTWEVIAELSKLTWIFCVCGYSETFQMLIALVRYSQSFISPHGKIRTWNLQFHSLSIEGIKVKFEIKM